mmetsp:Transcript_47208/g.124429  ORF Transcript_47208/g.124429 Transcript_47208/m.124429 type:complete len:217 (-) Transcript_47208:564-1214(-)
MLKLKCFSSVGANESSIGRLEPGPTTPTSGSTLTTDSAPAGPAANDARSKVNEKGRCSSFLRWIVSRARWPICSGPKLWRVRSSETAGSLIVPTSRKGTSICSSGMRKTQCDSCSCTVSGVKWKIISNLRPAVTTPLRVWQRKGWLVSTSAADGSALAGSKTNSYVRLVGLTTMKRRVLRTLVPSDSNSITLVDGSSGPSEPSGPGMSGERRPARR